MRRGRAESRTWRESNRRRECQLSYTYIRFLGRGSELTELPPRGSSRALSENGSHYCSCRRYLPAEGHGSGSTDSHRAYPGVGKTFLRSTNEARLQGPPHNRPAHKAGRSVPGTPSCQSSEREHPEHRPSSLLPWQEDHYPFSLPSLSGSGCSGRHLP